MIGSNLRLSARDVLRLAFALGAYALAGIVTPVFLLYAGGRLPWLSLDAAASCSRGSALVRDLALLLLFALPHSLLASSWFKRSTKRLLPRAPMRSIYVGVASLSLALLMLRWQPIGGVVWQTNNQLHRIGLDALYWTGFALVYVATLWIDHFSLLGLRQAWLAMRGMEESPPQFKQDGPYRLVRHPLMLGLLMVFWAVPKMTWGHVLFSSFMTLYILVGVWLEERALLRVHGSGFLHYQLSTPMLIPAPWRWLDGPARTAGADAGQAPAFAARTAAIDFTVDEPELWYRGNLFGTLLLNSHSLLFPPLESWMVACVRSILPLLPAHLRRDEIDAFLQQETIHPETHARSFQILVRQGYRLDPILRLYDWVVATLDPILTRIARPIFGVGFMLSVFAAVEHWGASMAEVSLGGDFGRLGAGPMKQLYYWHGAEELEHKAVVYDLMLHFRCGYFSRILAFALATTIFVFLTIAGIGLLMYDHLRLHRAGRFASLRRMWQLGKDMVSYLLLEERMLILCALRFFAYLRPGFHPAQYDTSALVKRGLSNVNFRADAEL